MEFLFINILYAYINGSFVSKKMWSCICGFILYWGLEGVRWIINDDIEMRVVCSLSLVLMVSDELSVFYFQYHLVSLGLHVFHNIHFPKDILKCWPISIFFCCCCFIVCISLWKSSSTHNEIYKATDISLGKWPVHINWFVFTKQLDFSITVHTNHCVSVPSDNYRSSIGNCVCVWEHFDHR